MSAAREDVFWPPTTAVALAPTGPRPDVQVAPQPQQPAPDVSARFFTSPSEKRDELAVHKIAPRLYAGLEGEGQASYEHQGTETTNDAFLDSATLGLRWVPMYGLVSTFEGSYDLQGSEGFSVDEALLTLGAVPTFPWYVAAGHTELPFGEFESHFREDPGTAVLGEMQTEEVAAGYDTDWLELTGAVGKGGSGAEQYVGVGNFTFSPVKDMDVGVYWTNDIRESVEIRNLIEEHLAGAPAPPSSSVSAAGGFLSVKKSRYSVDLEYIAALDAFAPGLLDVDAMRPWAWNSEATYRPLPPWEVGARIEGSGDLPGSPTLQYGLETTWSIGQHAALSLEALHADFESGDPSRDKIVAGLEASFRSRE